MMGKHRFRLSDMIPNAWFYKLRNMGRTRNHNTTHPTKKKKTPTSSSSAAAIAQPFKENQPHPSHQRKSYYYTRELTTPVTPPTLHTTLHHENSPTNPKPCDTHFEKPPRKSSNKRHSSSRRNRASSVSTSCTCQTSLESVSTHPDLTPEEYPNTSLDSFSDLESVSWSTSGQCKIYNNVNITRKSDGFEAIPDLELPPIITKNPAKINNAKQEMKDNEATKFSSSDKFKEQRSKRSQGLRLRTNSPRIATRKSVSSCSSSRSRRSLSQSFAVVKPSSDPQKDFRESMVEMILENDIRAPKDLEELLACYLSLNSDKYHDLIIKVFRQIWFDFSDTQLK